MTFPEWLDRRTPERTPGEQLLWAIFSNEHEREDELEDLAYLMNALREDVDNPRIDDDGDFIPPWKVQI